MCRCVSTYVYVAVCAQDYTLSCLFSAVQNLICAMDHTLREELAFDIPLRELGRQLATMWPVRTLPKSVDQANRQRGLPDPIGYHLHPFVLKVNIEKREVTVGITDCEMAPGNKKKKERKLTGQHAYVQGAGVYTPIVMSAVKKILQENYPGLLVPTPSPQELWARPRGKREVILDDLEPEGHSLKGVQLHPPDRLEVLGPVDVAQWKQYHCLDPLRLWWCKDDTGEFFFEGDDAASKGWLRYTQEGSERQWYHQDFSGEWFFLDTGMKC